MHRFSRRILCYRRPTQTRARPYDVFINHRGIDTKRSVAGLLYDNLTRLKLHPFMDIKNMNPGDKLFEKIDGAIRTCKVGVAVLSPHYCESYFCLHELTSLLELEKKVIPIFVDIKPSELQIIDNGSYGVKELQRFRWALEEAKYTVGLTFDSCNGDWPDLITRASNIVTESLIEVDKECRERADGNLFSLAPLPLLGFNGKNSALSGLQKWGKVVSGQILQTLPDI
ncbi:hypothetical protein HHK36_032503 [Tetracentron sinense]|uniref:TIR domain-containing protein n=1 Tax=Tetracentron sinense TaxID=13715 RepID=A0A835CX55_TETSI|nr:hypothetical protein HHK36_032503 [Tetracentron sinense]